MKAEPFALATDGSNDSGLEKMNPPTVRIFNINGGRVTSQLLDMCLTHSGTAESIFTKIDGTLKQFSIDWERCIAFSVTSISVHETRSNHVFTGKIQLHTSLNVLVIWFIIPQIKLQSHLKLNQDLMLKICL